MKRTMMVHATTLAVLGALALAAATAAPAAAQPAPNPQRDQIEADLTFRLDREEYQLVWVEDRGAGPRIFSKRLRANGLPVGGAAAGEWELTGATGVGAAAGQKGEQRTPAIAGDLLVWSERTPGGTDFDLYAQSLFDNGRAQGRPRLLLARPGDQLYPDIVAVSRGLALEYLVVWSENTTDGGDIVGLRLSSALTARGAPFPVALGASKAEDPAIAPDLRDDDSLLVLWTDDRNGNLDIFGTRILQNGLPRGGALADFPVLERPEDDYAPAIVVSLNPERRIGSAPDPGAEDSRNARGLLVWTTEHPADGPDVRGQRLFANGLPQGSDFGIATGAGVQTQPAVTLKIERTEAGRTREDSVKQVEWLAVWGDQTIDVAATLDVLGVEVGLNGISRRPARALAAD